MHEQLASHPVVLEDRDAIIDLGHDQLRPHLDLLTLGIEQFLKLELSGVVSLLGGHNQLIDRSDLIASQCDEFRCLDDASPDLRVFPERLIREPIELLHVLANRLPHARSRLGPQLLESQFFEHSDIEVGLFDGIPCGDQSRMPREDQLDGSLPLQIHALLGRNIHGRQALGALRR